MTKVNISYNPNAVKNIRDYFFGTAAEKSVLECTQTAVSQLFGKETSFEICASGKNIADSFSDKKISLIVDPLLFIDPKDIPDPVKQGSSDALRSWLKSQFEGDIGVEDQAQFEETLVFYKELWKEPQLLERARLHLLMEKVIALKQRLNPDQLPSPSATKTALEVGAFSSLFWIAGLANLFVIPVGILTKILYEKLFFSVRHAKHLLLDDQTFRNTKDLQAAILVHRALSAVESEHRGFISFSPRTIPSRTSRLQNCAEENRISYVPKIRIEMTSWALGLLGVVSVCLIAKYVFSQEATSVVEAAVTPIKNYPITEWIDLQRCILPPPIKVPSINLDPVKAVTVYPNQTLSFSNLLWKELRIPSSTKIIEPTSTKLIEPIFENSWEIDWSRFVNLPLILIAGIGIGNFTKKSPQVPSVKIEEKSIPIDQDDDEFTLASVGGFYDDELDASDDEEIRPEDRTVLRNALSINRFEDFLTYAKSQEENPILKSCIEDIPQDTSNTPGPRTLRQEGTLKGMKHILTYSKGVIEEFLEKNYDDENWTLIKESLRMTSDKFRKLDLQKADNLQNAGISLNAIYWKIREEEVPLKQISELSESEVMRLFNILEIAILAHKFYPAKHENERKWKIFFLRAINKVLKTEKSDSIHKKFFKTY